MGLGSSLPPGDHRRMAAHAPPGSVLEHPDVGEPGGTFEGPAVLSWPTVQGRSCPRRRRSRGTGSSGGWSVKASWRSTASRRQALEHQMHLGIQCGWTESSRINMQGVRVAWHPVAVTARRETPRSFSGSPRGLRPRPAFRSSACRVRRR
jgi:hypothetical protein